MYMGRNSNATCSEPPAQYQEMVELSSIRILFVLCFGDDLVKRPPVSVLKS